MPRVRVLVPVEPLKSQMAPVNMPTVATATVEPPVVQTSVQEVAPPVDAPAQEVVPQATAGPSTVTLSRRSLIFAVIVIVGLIGVTFALTNRGKPKDNQVAQATNATTDAENEALRYHKEVSKVVEVPDTTPSLVTVNDAAKVAEKSPVLFKNAKNGDIVLFYLNADKTGKAVLFRPSTHKVIAVVDGVGNSGAQQVAPSTGASTTKKTQ